LIQRDLHRQLREELSGTRERIATMLRPLDLSRIVEHPEPNGWSIGQVLEHLLIADELYKDPVADLMRRSTPDAGAAMREWKPSLIGGLIAGSLLKPKPLKGPRVFRPGPTPRDGVVEALLTHESEFLDVMDGATGYDWRALRIRSPALPAWAPKMNIGDGFRIHVVHLTRHAGQIERLVGKLAS
jgi:hypothetical protein